MAQKKGGTGARKGFPVRLTLKEFYKEKVCRLYLKGFTYQQIIKEIYDTDQHTLDFATVKKYVSESVKEFQEKKDDWAAQITVLELEKVNLLESELWFAWSRSQKPVKTIKQKRVPIPPPAPGEPLAPVPRKRKNGPPVIPGYTIEHEVIETREQIGEVRFLLGIQWCVDKRLEILGHTSLNGKAKIKDGTEEEEKTALIEVQAGTRTIEFVTNAAK